MNINNIKEESNEKIINVYALFRDSEAHINRTLNQMASLTELPNLTFNFFFYQNDSKDNTLSILQDWCKLFNGKVLSEILNAPKFGSIANEIRTASLAYYRNKNKEMGKDTPSDYSLVIDSDLVWGNSDFNALLDFMEENQNFVAAMSNCRQNIKDLVFGESEDSHYDTYAFRDKINLGGVYFADTPFYRKEDKERFQNFQPVEVNSAFGGLGMFDSRAFDAEKWTSFGESEHVAFCGELRSWGKIAIVPTSKPFSHVDLTTLNLDNCKKIGEQQREKFEYINNLDSLSRDSEYKFQFAQNK